MHHPIKLILIVFACLLASDARAQLGPRPSEIPAARAEPQPQPRSARTDAEGASKSAMARPAIDEVLLSRARSTRAAEQQPQPVSPEAPEQVASRGTLQDDLRTGETLPPVREQSPGALAGAGEPNPVARRSSIDKGWLQTIAALGGVLLLILGLSQLFKRLARSQGGLAGQLGAGGSAPTGILEVIGRYPIGTGMTMVVLKFDRRVLLVASGAAGRGKHGRGATMQTLCELDDPEDVASVLLKARNASGESIARSFERALQEADDLTDDSIYASEAPLRARGPVRAGQQRREAPKTITSDEGDRAELWSTDSTGQAAAGVLRKRLASMRREHKSA